MEWALYPFAIAGLYLMVRRRLHAWPLFAALISVMVSTLVTSGNQRFRIGAEPTILIAAATAALTITSRGPARMDGDVVTST